MDDESTATPAVGGAGPAAVRTDPGSGVTVGAERDADSAANDKLQPVTAADAATQARDEPPSAWRSAFDWAVVIFVALLIAIVVRTFLLAHFRVQGSSMMDTLHENDRVFVNKISYRFHPPRRGEVVVLHELGGERDLIKRVIAMPGETVKIDQCDVYIDGRLLDEPYLSESVRQSDAWCEFGPVTVPPGDVFVMGDNRPASADSRIFGAIPEDKIVGRAFVIFWPTGDASWL